MQQATNTDLDFTTTNQPKPIAAMLTTPSHLTQANTPAISSSALLIDLSISVWTGRKQDKSAKAQVESNNHTATGVVLVTKKLLGDCAELDAVQKFAANARNLHTAMTMPWSDLGLRLCPTATYIRPNGYEQNMSGLQAEFFRLVEVFLTAYEWERQNAALKLGNLFNPAEYPTADDLRSKFKFRYTAMPMPDAGDWRLDVENEKAQQLKQDYEKFYTQQFERAMGDVWARCRDVVEKISERLDYTEKEVYDHATGKTKTEGKKIFRDTLVSNAHDILQLMGDCNLTSDPQMLDVQRRLASALEGVTPEALREDPALRAEVKARADEVRKIIDNLPSLGF